MKANLSILIFFCSAIIFSCKKETITVIKEIPVNHSWSLDSSIFGFNKILLTSLPLNDSTLAVANSSLIWYINPNKLNSSIDGAYINLNPIYGYLVSPSITKSICVSLIDSNRLDIFSTLNPVSNYGRFTFSPTYSNSTSSIKGFPLPFFRSTGYPIINAKYILAPDEIDFVTQTAICTLIKVDTASIPFPNSVSFSSSKNIILIPASSTIGFSSGGYFSAAYYNKFFISFYNQFYRIDTSGNVRAFGYSPVVGQSGTIFQMFTINNYLFAIGVDKFFVSQDQGENWSLFYNSSGSI